MRVALVDLAGYSLIGDNGDVISVHRLVQQLTRLRHTRSGTEAGYTAAAVELLAAALARAPELTVLTELLPHVLETTGHSERLAIAPEATIGLLVATASGLIDRGQLDSARPLLQRALLVADRALGADHPDALTTRNILLPAEDLPAEAAVLRDATVERLPHVPLASLLIELDAWTGFTDHLIHAGGATHRGPELRRNLYAALLAQACNLGIAGMADATGISEDTLAWTTEWYLREDTLRAANTAIVNAHHRQDLAQLWGGGTLSSSDGQRFPQRGKSLTARALSRYFVDEGTTTLTHVADQHATYGTKVIPSTVLEGTFTLDEILGNPTDLPIAEHAVDTAGQTLAVFAAFDLVGLRFSPRIRDLPSRRLYRLGPVRDLARFPHAGSLLSRPIQTNLIVSQWDELLRLGASLKFGHASASLLLSKLQAGSRHNALARGLLEYGRLIRTLFILRYLADIELRRRVHRQLNKGESLNALRRQLFYANAGHVRRRHHDSRLCASPWPPTPWSCSTRSTSKTPSTPSKPKGAPSTSRPPPTCPRPSSTTSASTATTPSTSNKNCNATVTDPFVSRALQADGGNPQSTVGSGFAGSLAPARQPWLAAWKRRSPLFVYAQMSGWPVSGWTSSTRISGTVLSSCSGAWPKPPCREGRA